MKEKGTEEKFNKLKSKALVESIGSSVEFFSISQSLFIG